VQENKGRLNLQQWKERMLLPEPLRGSDVGTFTERTLWERIPAIARRIVAENGFAPEIAARLLALAEEIPLGKIRPFLLPNSPKTTPPDFDDWQAYAARYIGETWLTVPWFFAETYFFRRVLEATDYFANDIDPYAYQKRRGLETALASWRKRPFPTILPDLLLLDLWGNQMDMGLWSVDDAARPEHGDEAQLTHLLVDDRTAVCRHLQSQPPGHIVFVNDNVGAELLGDLLLADWLLQSGTAVAVTFHLKPHPTFVSDATIADVATTISQLRQDDEFALQQLGNRLLGWQTTNALRLTAHPFWVSPLPWWMLPDKLADELAQARLVISKGDANYRRLLGDCHWPYTTPFADVVGYFPAPLLVLRTLKSEQMLGLTAARLAELEASHLDWLVSGEWGVIQWAENK
jgi:uncharacterized protein with ATP-grasp and redox domains